MYSQSRSGLEHLPARVGRQATLRHNAPSPKSSGLTDWSATAPSPALFPGSETSGANHAPAMPERRTASIACANGTGNLCQRPRVTSHSVGLGRLPDMRRATMERVRCDVPSPIDPLTLIAEG